MVHATGGHLVYKNTVDGSITVTITGSVTAGGASFSPGTVVIPPTDPADPVDYHYTDDYGGVYRSIDVNDMGGYYRCWINIANTWPDNANSVWTNATKTGSYSFSYNNENGDGSDNITAVSVS